MAKEKDLFALLADNEYPGRGLLLGRSEDGRNAVMAYFIMGRSANSRNRVFETTADGIRTRAFDPAKLSDPSLIIYHPVRTLGGVTVVTNGDQTDTIRDALAAGEDWRQALRGRTFEPDAPNYTPRISGVMEPSGSYTLSLLKTLGGDPCCCCRYLFEYESPQPGVGHLLHTYTGDGEPLPSFEGEPARVALDAATAESLAQRLWASLNRDNRVSLFVRFRELESGQEKTVLVNRNGEGRA